MQRNTLADYEQFVFGLCGLPPSEDRDRCARGIVRQLMAMYRERGVEPPPGLQAFATQIGVDANTADE